MARLFNPGIFLHNALWLLRSQYYLSYDLWMACVISGLPFIFPSFSSALFPLPQFSSFSFAPLGQIFQICEIWICSLQFSSISRWKLKGDEIWRGLGILGTLDEQRTLGIYRYELFLFKPSWLSVTNVYLYSETEKYIMVTMDSEVIFWYCPVSLFKSTW